MKQLITTLILLVFSLGIFSQEKTLPFWKDIQEFKKQDSTMAPPSNAILLIGSSSFTLWRDVQEYFKGYTIVNRGFGGSTLEQQLLYVNDIIFPYKPKQIIIYCGENDLASSDSITSQVVFDRFRQLFDLIRKQLPDVYIAYVSMKPSPSRQMLMAKMREGNEKIRQFLKKRKRTAYIDVYKEMIDDENKPIASLFRDDNLHMNKNGYAIWQRKIKPYLVK